MDGAEKVLYQKGSYKFVVALDWPEKDLSVLQLIGKRLRGTVPLSEAGPAYGQKVVWLGYPLGNHLVMSVGNVGNPNVQGMMSIFGQVIPGNSGSPVFDETGKLLGIVSSTMALPGIPFPQFLPVGYAVHWDNLRTAIDKL
jgi:S1-C subfamily serine protease